MTDIASPKVKFIAVDPVTQRSIIEHETKQYTLEKRDQFLYLINRETGREHESLGRILHGARHESPNSGSIWRIIPKKPTPEALGEFTLNPKDGTYQVTPYENGQRNDAKKENIHPLDYLLRNL
ncbi:MAG: hypothetical protein AABW63_00640 [Nanoarchaeota archaeon]